MKGKEVNGFAERGRKEQGLLSPGYVNVAKILKIPLTGLLSRNVKNFTTPMDRLLSATHLQTVF